MTFAFRHVPVWAAVLVISSSAAVATEPKLDAETCSQLRLEHMKYVESGIAADMQRGAEWGKANLSADKLRDVELFIQLDEQINFGCRDAKLTMDAERAAEAAKRLELNPDLDPTTPLPADAQGTGDSDGDGVADTPAKTTATVGTKPKSRPKAEHKSKPKPNDAAKAVVGGDTAAPAAGAPAAATP